jgi:ABC-type nitrate/sulfonate/bicarbonate transport system substrate-binding protein
MPALPYSCRDSLLLGGLMVLATLLLFAPWAAAAPAPAELTIAVAHNPMSLPLHLAAQEGHFTAEGLKVRLVECPTGARCLAAMLEGSADLATVADTPVVFRSFERSDFVLLGTFASSTDDAKILARKDSGIERPRQLAGRRIGVTRGTFNQYHLDAYLLMHGMAVQSVETVGMAPEMMADALQSGRVDAVSSFEPHAWRIQQQLGANVVRLPAGNTHTVIFNLAAQRRMAGSRDADLAAVLRAVERAQQSIREQPARAQALLAERFKVDQAFVDAVWPHLQYRLRLDSSLVKTLESEARWAMREGYVRNDGMPDYLGFIHAAPLRSALPAAVSLAR